MSKKKKLKLRDRLAIDRTSMANHRTLLAYIRTAILFMATGLSLFKLFPESRSFGIIASVSLLIAAGFLVLGTVLFFYNRKRIDNTYGIDYSQYD